MPKVLHRSHIFSVLALMGLLAFTAISVYYIAFFHVSPLSRDQWHMYAPYFEKGLLHAALTPMSTHRHLFPFFIFDMDMQLFGGRNHFLIFFGSFFDCLIILLFAITLKNDTSLSGFEKITFFVLITAALTWLVNIAQLGWGFMSTQYYLAIFAYLFSIYSAYNYCHRVEAKAWFVSSIVCGIVSTFSFGMGILVWPALLYFSYMWRAPARYTALVILSCIFCLLVFMLLPGGKFIEEALLFSFKSTVAFLFQLAGGPIYYLLKSYRIFDTEIIKFIASTISIIATSIGIFLLLRLLISRRKLTLFSNLCCALVLVGLGTATLITFTRHPFFLDVWVDRYQLWATLFWTGLLPLCYTELLRQKNSPLDKCVKKIFLGALLIFPIIALPSQLDMGARLSEYKIRVQQSLLAYQVGIPDKHSAEEALHWNWEAKLPPFFTVLNYLQDQQKNIYYNNLPDILGKNIERLNIQQYDRVTSLVINKTDAITHADLLDLKNITTAGRFASIDIPTVNNIVAYKIKGNMSSPGRWTRILITNEVGVVNGLGIAIEHSKLPRSQLKHINAGYNFFAVVRNDGSVKHRFYFLDGNDTAAVMVSDAINLTRPQESRPTAASQ